MFITAVCVIFLIKLRWLKTNNDRIQKQIFNNNLPNIENVVHPRFLSDRKTGRVSPSIERNRKFHCTFSITKTNSAKTA